MRAAVTGAAHAVTQAFAIASLQVRALLQKRVLGLIVVLWIAQVAILLRTGGRAAPVAFLLTFAVTDILTVAMTCGLIADDAERGTFQVLLSHGIERRTYLVGKLVPVVLIALAFATLAHTATLLVFRTDEPMGILAAWRVAQATAVSLVRILALTSLTAWMAVILTNRQSAAIGALLYCYGLPYLVHGLWGSGEPGAWLTESLLLWRESFGRLPAEIYARPVPSGQLAASVLQPLVYGTLLGAFAMRALERRDLARA